MGGKLIYRYGKSPFIIGKSVINDHVQSRGLVNFEVNFVVLKDFLGEHSIPFVNHHEPNEKTAITWGCYVQTHQDNLSWDRL